MAWNLVNFMFDHVDPEKAARIFFGCTPRDIHPVCVLTWLYAPYREHFEDVVEFAGWRKGFSGTHKGHPLSVIVPGMGPCAAGDAVIFLKYTGCTTIIYSGAAGGFAKCSLGDVLVPTKAVIGEGFSQYYTEAKEIFPDRELLETVRKKYLGERIHFEPIFTIDSIAAQKKDLLLELERKGVAGIDIETSAIFTASSYCNTSCVAIHYISDLPLERSLLDSFAIDELKNIKDGLKRAVYMSLGLACCYQDSMDLV